MSWVQIPAQTVTLAGLVALTQSYSHTCWPPREGKPDLLRHTVCPGPSCAPARTQRLQGGGKNANPWPRHPHPVPRPWTLQVGEEATGAISKGRVCFACVWRPTMCSLGGACSLLSETHRVLGHVWTKGEWLSSYQAPDALQVYFLNSTRKQNLSA